MPPSWPFPLMPMDVVPDEEAIVIADRAWEEADERWVPISPAFAQELQHDGDIACRALGISIIPRTRRWDENSLCYCILPADPHRWRSHGLLRTMTISQFTEWQQHWPQEDADAPGQPAR